MRKQMVSGLLVLCLLAGLLPVSALALEEPDVGEDTGFVTGPAQWDGWDEDLFELQPPPEEGDGTAFVFLSDADPEEEHLSYPDYGSMPMPIADMLPEQYNCNIGNLMYQSEVKNQSRNGLCWAFGMYGAVEANMLKNHLGEQDFSEMHLAHATSNSSGENPLEGLSGHAPNSGRTRYTSSAYLMRDTDLSGAVDEAEDLYWPEPLPERPLDETRSKEKSYKVQNIRFLGDGKEAPRRDSTLFTVIKQAVMDYGGVGADIYIAANAVTGEDRNPRYYNEETAAHCFNYEDYNVYVRREGDKELSKGSLNHEVEIVGWDDAYPVDNFSSGCRPNLPGAWLVKNSWGPDWGDNGYFWVSYEDSNFPLVAYCVDGVKPYDPSVTVYETDYLLDGSSYGWSSGTSVSFAKVFWTRTAGETVTAVKVFIPQASRLEVDCIPNFDARSPTTFSGKGSLDAAYPGWYTIALDKPVTIADAETTFAVEVKLTVSSGQLRLCYDSYNPLETGATFYRFGDNGAWHDAAWSGVTDEVQNFCIKAVTKPADAAQATADKARDQLIWYMIRGGNEEEDYVRFDLELPTSFRYGTEIIWTSSDPDVITAGGRVTRPETGQRTVTLTAEVRYGERSSLKTFNLRVFRVEESLKTALGEITWDTIRGANTYKSAVTETLNCWIPMPSGVSLTWTCDREGLIDCATGAVTRPRFDKIGDVTLTAAVSNGDETETVSFDLTVPPLEATYEIMGEAAAEWLQGSWENWKKNWWGTFKGENTNYNAITQNLYIPDSLTITGENGVTYTVEITRTWAQIRDENGEAVAWTYVALDGTVTRPPYPGSDSTGTFFVYCNGKTMATYSMTVRSYKGAVALTGPETQIIDEAGNVRLSVTAATEGAPGTISYQWYYSDNEDGSGARPVTGATEAVYTTESVPSGTYYFYCEASAPDAVTAKSDTVKVTVANSERLGFKKTGPRSLRFTNTQFFPITAISTVYAVTYAGGRMTDVNTGTISGDAAFFSKDLKPDAVLFFLTSGSAPVYEKRSMGDAA